MATTKKTAVKKAATKKTATVKKATVKKAAAPLTAEQAREKIHALAGAATGKPIAAKDLATDVDFAPAGKRKLPGFTVAELRDLVVPSPRTVYQCSDGTLMADYGEAFNYEATIAAEKAAKRILQAVKDHREKRTSHRK